MDHDNIDIFVYVARREVQTFVHKIKNYFKYFYLNGITFSETRNIGKRYLVTTSTKQSHHTIFY